MPDLLGAGIQAGAGLLQTAVGLINAGKAKKEARELERTRPKYEISPLAGEELSLAESELASGGLSSRAQTAYNNLNNQQFSTSLDAILRGGGSVNNVSDVFGENEEGRLRLAQLQDQMRLSKINNLVAARRYNTEQTDKKFMYNEDAPWKDKAQAVGQARQQAEQMVWSGLGTAGAGGINYSSQRNQENQYNKYLNTYGGNNRMSNSVNPPDYNFGIPPPQFGVQPPIYGDPNPDLMQFKIDY